MSRTSNTVSVSRDLIKEVSDLDAADLKLSTTEIDNLRNPETSRTTLINFKAQAKAFATALEENGLGQTGREILLHFKSIGDAIKKG